jgi:hypothetical protein
MDAGLLRQHIAMIAVVSTQWFAVAAAPFAAVGAFGRISEFDGWAVALVTAMVAYCFYTGYRAWKRGWQSRFTLRLVVPAVLLVLSCIVAGIGLWIGWFNAT